MTQPDEYFPEDAANYGSFSAWSQKTQEDYENERHNKENTRWNRVRTGLRWEIPDGWVLGEWYQTVLTEHTEAIANLNDVAAATNTTVAYVGDLEDMVSFPRSDLVTLAPGSTSAFKYHDVLDGFSFSCADNSHSHGWTEGACPTIVPEGKTLSSSIGHIYYAPIVVDRHGIVDKLRWIVGPDDSLVSANYYEMALCVYNPSTLNVEKVWSSGNITTGVPDTTTMQETAIAMGLDQECTPGQLLFVAHQQVAPGAFQNCRRFAAKRQAGISRPGLLLDAACYVAEDYSQGIPSSISFASLTRENRFIPWAAVSVNAIEGS